LNLRLASWVLALAILVTATGLARVSLERQGARGVPAGLLYLPQGPYLRALAVGHEETLADVLYIWSIQYYSSYEDATRYDYLEKVFRDAITELDPLFTEPYLVGGMIMSVEARRPDLALRLYDKGLEAMPHNWDLAYWAGWDAYFAEDYRTAREYWLRGAQMDEAPPWLWRLAAKMLERTGDIDSALDEYRRLAENSKDEKTARFARMWLDRAETEIALDVLDDALASYRSRYGTCPGDLGQLVERGVLERLPTKEDGSGFFFDPEACRVLPGPGGTIESAR